MKKRRTGTGHAKEQVDPAWEPDPAWGPCPSDADQSQCPWDDEIEARREFEAALGLPEEGGGPEDESEVLGFDAGEAAAATPGRPSWRSRRRDMTGPYSCGRGDIIAVEELRLAAVESPGPTVGCPRYAVVQTDPEQHPWCRPPRNLPRPEWVSAMVRRRRVLAARQRVWDSAAKEGRPRPSDKVWPSKGAMPGEAKPPRMRIDWSGKLREKLQPAPDAPT